MYAASTTPTATAALPPQRQPVRTPRAKGRAGRELSEQEVLAMAPDDYMNELQLDFFRARLEALRAGLEEKAQATTQGLREVELGAPDLADRATIEEEHALELRTRDRERKLLRKIEESLQRISSGDYGWCEETGEEIGVARLIARPTATLTVEAQARRELRHRMFGEQ
ncbi:RNA polymerase-binding protein DksA [Ideonella sp. BN130291]|uniref:RNA polymerase-binding protein DksA n=1 Tax=Ideonella sp. BN130291 TaxID=3112940 RepID=UPI002E263FA6|nr:RNA polymerase-binding protein DksA [Ideonella sp. BN130291]